MSIGFVKIKMNDFFTLEFIWSNVNKMDIYIFNCINIDNVASDAYEVMELYVFAEGYD